MDLSRIVLPVLHNKRFKICNLVFFFSLHQNLCLFKKYNSIAQRLSRRCRQLHSFIQFSTMILLCYYLLFILQTWYIKINVIISFLASLFYTSVKEDKNCDLLYKYLVHRIFGFPFKTPALVVEKDAVFM